MPISLIWKNTAFAIIAVAGAPRRAKRRRVAASAVARKVLDGVTIRGALVQMGPHEINRENWDWDEAENNPFWCPDAQAKQWEEYLDGVRKAAGCGAVIEVVSACPSVGARLFMAS